nr:hypothetical protein [Gemmatimonadota bacterium]
MFVRSKKLLALLALAGLVNFVGCQEKRVEDESTEGDRTVGRTGEDRAGMRDTMMDEGMRDTMGGMHDSMMMHDTTGMTDAGGTGNTTLNFEDRTATSGTGQPTRIGGTTEGGVTTREGAAAGVGGTGETGRSGATGTGTSGTGATGTGATGTGAT